MISRFISSGLSVSCSRIFAISGCSFCMARIDSKLFLVSG